ncbi:MAG: hypothetical protein N2515_01380 [Deltaproteobacteria bacterium]|nr:hypothetical protein [Deltaproteobacteria bacterium]
MNKKTQVRLFTVALLCGMVGGYAMGQESNYRPGQSSEEGGEASFSVQRASDLKPEEQVAESQRLLARAQALAQRIQSMLDQARRESDIMRVTCLDDKLTQVNAHVRSLNDRVRALEEAIRIGDEARRNHEFTVIIVLSQNISTLHRASNDCIGVELFDTGSTRVVTIVDPTVPQTDPGVIPFIPPDVVPYIPPPASPGF